MFSCGCGIHDVDLTTGFEQGQGSRRAVGRHGSGSITTVGIDRAEAPPDRASWHQADGQAGVEPSGRAAPTDIGHGAETTRPPSRLFVEAPQRGAA